MKLCFMCIFVRISVQIPLHILNSFTQFYGGGWRQLFELSMNTAITLMPHSMTQYFCWFPFFFLFLFFLFLVSSLFHSHLTLLSFPSFACFKITHRLLILASIMHIWILATTQTNFLPFKSLNWLRSFFYCHSLHHYEVDSVALELII